MIYIIGLILLWFRSEYAFVFFFGLGLAVLDFLFLVFAGGLALFTDPGALTLQLVGEVLVDFVMSRLPVLAIFTALGCLIVAFRKWQKNRKSPNDKALDSEMERIRAEIAQREERRMIFWIIVAWIVLGAKPSRNNLFLLTGVVAIVSLIGLAIALGSSETPVNAADVLPFYLVGLALWLALFLGVGFIIIWIRGGSVEGDAAKSKKLDKEMERIRAEIASRDGQAPP